MQQSTANTTGNLVKLSDIFCRNVNIQSDHSVAENLVKLGRELVDEFSSYAEAHLEAYFQGSNPDHILLDFNDFMNGRLADIVDIMDRIDKQAYKAGLTTITLPFVYQSEAGKWLHKEVIKKYSFNHINFLLLPAKYDEDNTHLGIIHENLEEKTMLWQGDMDTIGPFFAVDLSDDMQDRFMYESRVFAPF